jgi:hypothetical protein
MALPRLLVVFAIVLATAGCRGSSESNATGSSGQTVSAKEWVGDLCTAIGDWQVGLKDVPDASNNTDLAKVKTDMAAFLDTLVTGTDELVGRIDKAGAPDIEDGDQAARDFKAAFVGLETSFKDAKSTIDAVTTDDQAKFAGALTQVGMVLKSAVETAGKAFDDISKKYPDLAKAGKDAPACNQTGS